MPGLTNLILPDYGQQRQLILGNRKQASGFRKLTPNIFFFYRFLNPMGPLW